MFMADYSYDRTDGSAVAIPVQPVVVDAPTSLAIITRDVATGDMYTGNPYAQMAALANGNDRLEDFYLDFAGKETVDISGHNLTLSLQLDALEIKSITAYREYESKTPRLDLDGGSYSGVPLGGGAPVAIPVFHTSGHKTQDQFSQEFQFIGNALDSRLNYVVGLYYFDEEGKETNPWYATYYNDQAGINVFLDGTTGVWYNTKTRSEAVYGQFGYDFTDQLTVTLGMRYTEDKKTLTLLAEDPMLLQDEKGSDKWNEFTSALTVWPYSSCRPPTVLGHHRHLYLLWPLFCRKWW